METFIIKLAVAVGPLITLVGIVTLADICSRNRKTLRFRAKYAQAGIHHAFAVAATQKWL